MEYLGKRDSETFNRNTHYKHTLSSYMPRTLQSLNYL
jgi:hypothetical protein